MKKRSSGLLIEIVISTAAVLFVATVSFDDVLKAVKIGIEHMKKKIVFLVAVAVLLIGGGLLRI